MKKLNSIIILSLFWLFSSSLISYGQCTYSVCLEDTYGDGWNGGTLSVVVGGSTVVSSATISDGYGPSCYNFTVSQGQTITVNYSGGSWTTENYYTVYNSSNGGGSVIYASTYGSTPPTSQSITNSCTTGGGGGTTDCTNSICLYDTYGDSWNGGSVNVSVGGTTVVSGATVSSGYGPSCYNFNITEGDAITINYSAGSYSYENYYQIFSGPNGTGSSLYNSGSGSTPPSSQVVTASCSGGNPPASDCMSALPFCTSDSYTFPASTNVPDMGEVGCLYTTPNPAWYWMEIGSPGNIDIYMSSGGDVDFIAWGPFTSLEAACSSNLMSNSGVDCSYSTAAQETANLTNTQTGEVYVLLITNYANIVTNISFSQTGGAGSTNCGIIAPPITNNGPLCEGETLQLSVSNPTTGATYLWSGPDGFSSTSMNPTISNVTTDNAGTYSLVITVGAETSPPVTTDVVINPNVTPTFAAGGTYCSGAVVSALPTTSTNGITGSWSPAINNTSTTTYTFTPNAGQCATTTTNTITITPNTTPTFNAVGPYCSGTSIPALPTTSTNGITGTWSPAINNTATTTYTFTPTSGQCATTTSLTINITPLTTPTFTQVGPFCSGTSISPLPTTSTNGISGTWSPSINNTSTTTYTFTPTAGQCAQSTTMTITINPNLLPTFTTPGPYCSGESIPTLPTTSGNGITGSWSPAINNTVTTNYTFTPSTGQCATSTNLEIIVNDNLLPTFAQAGPYCYGTSISPLPTTSTNGVIGSWSPGLNNTATTTYTFTPNAGQCASTAEMTIDITQLESQVLNTTNQFCDAPGTASVTGVNGTPNYSYLWPSNASGVNNGSASNLSSGNYIVTITDAANCQTTQEFTIGFTDNMTASASLIQHPQCFGDYSGSIGVAISNGTQPFTITCDSLYYTSNQNNYNIANLNAGTYSFNITDINGCQAIASYTLNNPPELIATASFTQIACSGENATVTVSASGGTPSYSGTGTFQVLAGTYNYTITDYNGCTDIAQVTVPEAPAELSISSTVNNISCFGANDGSISINPSGGTAPFFYNWNIEQSTSTITGLEQGAYSVTVSDYNDCSISESFAITEPAQIDLLYTIENLSCYGASNGVVQMEASGGSTPYSYEIYNIRHHADGAFHDNLQADIYTISVRDSRNCETSENIVISSPAELLVSVVTSNPSCIGNNDGYIEIYANGGTEPYSYKLDQMMFPEFLISRLEQGNYNIEVIDANSCSKKVNMITLTDNPVDCIVIPNAFTPNGDGINDTWVIEGLEKFPNTVIQIYNRWGQIVFNSTPENLDWDALYNGKLLPAGTYVFFLNLFNGDDPYTGTVTVVH